MNQSRPLPPANINPWAKTIEADVDTLKTDVARNGTNAATALQTANAAIAALSGQGMGSTGSRDELFGAPPTTAAQVALANKKVIWFNTDTMVQESYFATTGMTGLTTRGLISSVPPGWHPISGCTPICSIYRNTAQSMPNGAFTPVQFNTEVTNPYGMWNVASSTRIYIAISGSYQINAGGGVNASGGRVGIQVHRSGVAMFGSLTQLGTEVGATASDIWDLVGGEYVELTIYQETGAAQNTSTSAYGRPFLSVKYLNPPLAP